MADKLAGPADRAVLEKAERRIKTLRLANRCDDEMSATPFEMELQMSAGHAAQVSALRAELAESKAALVAQASAFDKERAAFQAELDALKASTAEQPSEQACAGSKRGHARLPAAAPHDIEIASARSEKEETPNQLEPQQCSGCVRCSKSNWSTKTKTKTLTC